MADRWAPAEPSSPLPSSFALAELQRCLLPAELPVLPCAEVAARYVPAADPGRAGGDWFDAPVLTGGLLGLVTGDVPGAGAGAVAAMSQLRAVLADHLHAEPDAAAALAAVDAAAGRVPGARGASVCAAVLDAPAGRLVYGTRGHPAPLVLGASGARRLPGTGGGPLGSGRAGAVRTALLEPGDLVVLLSDGLVHRPGRAPAEGSAELLADLGALAARPAGSAAPPAERICERAVELLLRGGPPEDDAVVLTARVRAAVPPLEIDLAAVPASLAVARRGLRRWLLDLGAGEEDVLAAELGVGEALANSLVHGYRGRGGGRLRVAADLGADGSLRVRVADDGRWSDPVAVPGDGGRGLAMIAALGEDLAVESAPDRTVVSFTRRVGGPRRRADRGQPRAGGGPGAGGADELQLELVRPAAPGPGPLLRVAGAVEADGLQHLAAELLRAARGGRVAVVVDLRDVTHLPSAAVQVLQEARDRAAAGGTRVRLLAPAGGPAAFALDLAGLPREEPPGA